MSDETTRTEEASPLGSRECRTNPDKLRYELIPPEAEEALAAVLTYGAKKYSARNWEAGLPWSETVGSLRRHLAAFIRGEFNDPESGLPHTGHILANAAFLHTMAVRRPDLDDITPPRRH